MDTIFGTWNIVHPAKDCRDLHMSIETRRDIFRRDMMQLKRQEKLKKMKIGKNKTGNNFHFSVIYECFFFIFAEIG